MHEADIIQHSVHMSLDLFVVFCHWMGTKSRHAYTLVKTQAQAVAVECKPTLAQLLRSLQQHPLL